MIYLAAALFSIITSCLIVKTDREHCLIWNPRKTRTRFFLNFQEIKNRLLIYISALPVFLLSALRYGIGTDYFYTYVPSFVIVANGGRMHFEVLFHLLIKIITMFTDNYQWLFIVTSFLFVYIVYNNIYCVSKNIPMALAVFFLSYVYFISLNNVRQAIASAFLLLAIRYLIEDDIKKYIFFCLVAGLNHQVGFIGLVFLVVKLKKIRLTAGMQLVLTMAGIVAIKFGAFYIIKIITLIPRLSLYFKLEELLIYTEPTISIKFTVLNLLFLVIFWLIEKTDNDFKFDTDWEISKWTQTFYMLVCAMDGIVPAAYRILRVFIFIQFITIPNALEHCKNKRDKHFYYMFVLIAFFIMFMELYLAGSEQVFPYVSIFDV